MGIAQQQSVGISGWSANSYLQGAAGELPGEAAFTVTAAFGALNPLSAAAPATLFSNFIRAAGAVHAKGWFLSLSGAATGFIAYAGLADGSASGTGLRLSSPLAADAGALGAPFNVLTLAADNATASLHWNGVRVADAAVGTIEPSTDAPLMGALIPGAPSNIFADGTIFGAGYTAQRLTDADVRTHALACLSAGRMVDGAIGGGAFPTVPTFDHLYDAFANNRGDVNNLIASANPAVGNMPRASDTWADLKTATPVNLTRQGALPLYAVGHKVR